jgi:hypothetical protein
MSGYDSTIELVRGGNVLALNLLKECYRWVLQNGPEKDFAARWVLGGIPVINFRVLSTKGLLTRVGSSRQGHRAYYRMVDPEGVGQALHEIGYL